MDTTAGVGCSVSDAQCIAGGKVVVLTSQYQYHGEILDDSPTMTLKPGESLSFGDGDGYVRPSVATFDLAAPQKWTTSEPLTDHLFDAHEAPNLACFDDSVLVSDAVRTTDMHIYGLDTGQWRTPSVPPGAPSFPPTPPMGTRVWTGQELVFLPTQEIGESGTRIPRRPTPGARSLGSHR